MERGVGALRGVVDSVDFEYEDNNGGWSVL